jgi:hypothetical protein
MDHTALTTARQALAALGGFSESGARTETQARRVLRS